MEGGAESSRPTVKSRNVFSGWPPGSLPHRRSSGLDLRLHGVEVEARSLLHRGELDRCLGEFRNLLLDEDEAPELVLEPGEVILSTVLRSIFRPAGPLERIEAQVGQVGDVGVGFVT